MYDDENAVEKDYKTIIAEYNKLNDIHKKELLRSIPSKEFLNYIDFKQREIENGSKFVLDMSMVILPIIGKEMQFIQEMKEELKIDYILRLPRRNLYLFTNEYMKQNLEKTMIYKSITRERIRLKDNILKNLQSIALEIVESRRKSQAEILFEKVKNILKTKNFDNNIFRICRRWNFEIEIKLYEYLLKLRTVVEITKFLKKLFERAKSLVKESIGREPEIKDLINHNIYYMQPISNMILHGRFDQLSFLVPLERISEGDDIVPQQKRNICKPILEENALITNKQQSLFEKEDIRRFYVVQKLFSNSGKKLDAFQSALVHRSISCRPYARTLGVLHTGAGKTLAALTAAHILLSQHSHLICIIVSRPSALQSFRSDMMYFGNAKTNKYHNRIKIMSKEIFAKRSSDLHNDDNNMLTKGNARCTILILDEAQGLSTHYKRKEINKRAKGRYARRIIRYAAICPYVIMLTATPVLHNIENFNNIYSIMKAEPDAPKPETFKKEYGDLSSNIFSKTIGNNVIYKSASLNSPDYPRVEYAKEDNYYNEDERQLLAAIARNEEDKIFQTNSGVIRVVMDDDYYKTYMHNIGKITKDRQIIKEIHIHNNEMSHFNLDTTPFEVERCGRTATLHYIPPQRQQANSFLMWINNNNQEKLYNLGNLPILFVKSGYRINDRSAVFVIICIELIDKSIDVRILENRIGTKNFEHNHSIAQLATGTKIISLNFYMMTDLGIEIKVETSMDDEVETLSDEEEENIAEKKNIQCKIKEEYFTGTLGNVTNTFKRIEEKHSYSHPHFHGGARRMSIALSSSFDVNVKFKKAMDIFEENITAKTVLFTVWKQCGVKPYEDYLNNLKLKYSNPINGVYRITDFEIFIYTGNTTEKKRKQMKESFNSRPRWTKRGRNAKVTIMIITTAGAEGLDLMGTYNIILTEPMFASAQEEQVLGRVVRKFAHYTYPPEEQFVRVFRLLLVKPPIQYRPTLDIELDPYLHKKSVDMILFEDIQGIKREFVKKFHERLEVASQNNISLVSYYNQSSQKTNFQNSEVLENDGLLTYLPSKKDDKYLVVTLEEEREDDTPRQEKSENLQESKDDDDEEQEEESNDDDEEQEKEENNRYKESRSRSRERWRSRERSRSRSREYRSSYFPYHNGKSEEEKESHNGKDEIDSE
jgi:superfamily II DNA or RNA helicase